MYHLYKNCQHLSVLVVGDSPMGVVLVNARSDFLIDDCGTTWGELHPHQRQEEIGYNVGVVAGELGGIQDPHRSAKLDKRASI